MQGEVAQIRAVDEGVRLERQFEPGAHTSFPEETQVQTCALCLDSHLQCLGTWQVLWGLIWGHARDIGVI